MKAAKWWYLGSVMTVMLVLSGCTSTQMRDMSDCVTLSVGVGLGLDATCKVGALMHGGIGVIGSRTVQVGLQNWARYGVWEEEQYVWPYTWVVHEQVTEGMHYEQKLSVLCSYTRERYPALEKDPFELRYWAPIFEKPPKEPSFRFHELTDLELGATLGLFSARVGVNPLEIVDLILGVFNIDIAKDDGRGRE